MPRSSRSRRAASSSASAAGCGCATATCCATTRTRSITCWPPLRAAHTSLMSSLLCHRAASVSRPADRVRRPVATRTHAVRTVY
jgi:hypothetical protein